MFKKNTLKILIFLPLLTLMGCWESDTENALEDVGEKVEEVTNDVGDNIEDKVEDIKE